MIILSKFFLSMLIVLTFTLRAQPKPDETVILDNFEDTWGDKPGQNNLGAVKGYFENGKNNVQMGGGFWYTFSDNGSTVMNGDATDTVSFINTGKLVVKENENRYMNVWLKTAQSTAVHPYAGVGCMLSGTGAGHTHDLTKMTSVKLKVKGQGKVSLRLETKDVAAAYDWGFYQYEIILTPEWKDITIPVSSLKPPLYSEPAGKGWTWDHGKKEAVKLSFQVKDTIDVNLLVDDILFEGMKYLDVTPIGYRQQKEYIFQPLEIKTYKNSLHFTLGRTDYVTLSVFDLKGKYLVTLIDGKMEKGTYSLPWNAKNKNGNSIAKGSYIANFKAGFQSHRKKFTLYK